MRASIETREVYSFASQKKQYPDYGPEGISYFAGRVSDGLPPVDCLLYRERGGRLLGILNHYPVDMPPWEKAHNVNLWVDPARRRRGIGTALCREALRRWPEIDLAQQRYTDDGIALVRSLQGEQQ